ncbi:hypothetical protein PMAYCL1PPCAC_16682 [Pristionchus mayeri]|uniref:Nuclear receptor n=1 Tax=Pristionchus mayeri TaxID=1317129 RepID=A0AAN5I033_9BILA|nr:hypothetical protein PMAYCL1PPCAC_16682 [Pristionchus mayeri]
MPDCLICGKETTATHMGMDACRACTVFFRRNRGARGRLQCINGTSNCKDYRKGIYTCRKCRLDRFDAVMAAGRKGEVENQDITITPSPSSSLDSPIYIPDRLSFEFNTAMEEGTSVERHTPPQTPSMTTIERIRAAYRALSLMRRTHEFQLRGIWMDPFEAEKEEYDLIPCTYQLMNEGTRILITGLFDFIPSVFPEFNTLSIADKWLLIRNYQKIFHVVDSCLRMYRRYGEHSNLYVLGFGSYTSYLSTETVEEYFSDCTDQKNVLEAARTLRDCLQENCIKMKSQVCRMQPTEEEYLALMGIAFWSIENAEPNENLVELASRYRTEILSDLTARYRQTIGEEEGAIRIGGLYCLLMGFKKAEMNMKWEYEVYRILNVFDDNTYMYKLQMHRSDIEE